VVSESGSICFYTLHTNSSTVKSSGMNEYTLIKKYKIRQYTGTAAL